MMQLWMDAASALPYSNRVCQSMVEALLRMADNDDLQLHIPALAWDWMKKRPLLSPTALARSWFGLGTCEHVVRIVRKLGDVELITSYLFVVWSELSSLTPDSYEAMLDLIRGELGGIGAVGHRADLIQRLDYVMSCIDEMSGLLLGLYGEFRMVLLEMDEEATKTLAGMSQSHHPFLSTNMRAQVVTPPSCVPFPFRAHSCV